MPELACLGTKRLDQVRMRMAKRADGDTAAKVEISVATGIDNP